MSLVYRTSCLSKALPRAANLHLRTGLVTRHIVPPQKRCYSTKKEEELVHTPRHFKDTTPQDTLKDEKTGKPARHVWDESSSHTRPHEDWVMFHPVYSEAEVKAVKVARWDSEKMGDKVAHNLVKLLRKGFDIVTGYKHANPAEAVAQLGEAGKNMSVEELRKRGIIMTPDQWMMRFLFLESIAGVPGFVAAMLRHLRSLRLMRRDGGWIHKLLEEAENERMHLMTFMKISEPGWFFRLVVLGAQGVFFNLFFLSYMLSPRIAHRFVGKLEEEAVFTYSCAIEELEAGRVPEWTNLDAPNIAKDYWRLGPDAKMVDVLYVIRADEATHRFVNHTLANLKRQTTFNPFAMKEPDGHIKGSKAAFSEEESMKWAEEVEKEWNERKAEVQKEDAKDEKK
ncbi:alternative oxidase [Atractiella rhizophila]|nr:alternative oxidase [Atractiella rhizophila]